MGNIIAPPPAVIPVSTLVFEDSDARALLLSHLNRCKVDNPQLRRILERDGTAESVCRALKGGALGAGGDARDGFSALHAACACGWDDLVEALLKAGAVDVDAPSRELYTPLMLAAMCGRPGAARLLLEHGAQLGRRSRRGATAIAFAAQAAGSLDALRVLLDHPSCTPQLVRQRGFRERSALMLSILAHGSPGVVRALLGAGANPSEAGTDMTAVSVLHTCAQLARVDAMRELIAAGARADVATDNGTSVLHEVFSKPPSWQCPESAKRAMFRMLVDAGADVNRRLPGRSHTVLHFALASCREEATARMLLDSGVDFSIAVNEPVRLGERGEPLTLLHLACMRGWSRLVERLVQAGADTSLRNKDGMQPLHTAVLGCHAGTVAALLRLGADPMASCPDCYPSLAAWKMRRGVQALQAMMMAEDGAAVLPALAGLMNAGDQDGPRMTAVDLACCVARHIPTLEAFLERGARPSPEALALAEHAVPIMRAVVERPLLTPGLAARLPPRFRAAARETLLCLARPAATRDGRQVTLTPDAVASVLQQAAFPVSRWADPVWLAAQKTREPLARASSAGGQRAQQGGGALPPGMHMLGPGEQPPPFVQAVINQMQQQFGEVGAQPHFVVVHEEGQPALGLLGNFGAPGDAAAAGGVDQAGQGLQDAPGQQIHMMQFHIPLGPGGLPAAPGAAAGAPGDAAPPPGAAALPDLVENFMEGMMAGIADAVAGGAPPGGLPGAVPPFVFGDAPFMHDDDWDWLTDDEEVEEDEELDGDDLAGLDWQHDAPHDDGAPPAAALTAPTALPAALAAPAPAAVPAGSQAGPSRPASPSSQAAASVPASAAAPAAPAGRQEEQEEQEEGAGAAGPSGTDTTAANAGKRSASGSVAGGGSSGGYELRDRSKRQRH